MKLIYAIILLSLSGCFYQTVDSHDIQQANEVCKEHGGIYEISSGYDGNEKVYCNDNYSSHLNLYNKK